MDNTVSYLKTLILLQKVGLELKSEFLLFEKLITRNNHLQGVYFKNTHLEYLIIDENDRNIFIE